MEQNTQVATKPMDKFKMMLDAPSVQKTLRDALGDHKDTFVASLIDLYNGDTSLQTCSQAAVISEALRAATMHLPLNKALGFAYVVVFNNSVKRKDANGYPVIDPNTHKEVWDKVPTPQFVLGYKGYIQLALRTGQYRTINADVVYEGELRQVNKRTGEVDFNGERISDKVVGYFAYVELTNGFNKTLYMSVEEAARYAKRFSKSVPAKTTVEMLMSKAGTTPTTNKVGWEGNFDTMAIKTVVRRLLKTYGYLSVEMMTAVDKDNETDETQAVRNDMIADKGSTININIDEATYEEVDTKTGEVLQPEPTPMTAQQPAPQQPTTDSMPNF